MPSGAKKLQLNNALNTKKLNVAIILLLIYYACKDKRMTCLYFKITLFFDTRELFL